MSHSPLITAIAQRLRDVGYRDVATPFKVASVSFEFTCALRGRDGRALDLVILVDTTTGEAGDTEFPRVRRRIEALSRALDVSSSRLVLTVVLAGAATNSDVDGLAEICRVLIVEPIKVDLDGVPEDASARQQLDDRIRLLLPLDIPPREGGSEGGQTAEDTLLARLPASLDQEFVAALLESSRQGEGAVERELGRFISRRMEIKETP